MSKYEPLRLAETADIGTQAVRLSALPKGYVLREDLGLVTHEALRGQVVHRTPKPVVFGVSGLILETRAVKTPGGDYLPMFPEGEHYGGHPGHVNDLIAYRSRDRGRTWEGPRVAFDIDYSQHGFCPLIPKGSRRLYAFGTQPIIGMHTTDRGQGENAPIGYRYSDDDGQTWGEPAPTPLVHPDAPPMLFHLSDGKTLIALHHNRHSDRRYQEGFHGGNPGMADRAQVRFATSDDEGRTWSEPRFLFSNAAFPDRPSDLPLVKSLFRSIERESQPDGPDAMDRAEAGLRVSLSPFDFLSSDCFWLLLALRDGAAVGYATLVRVPKADARVAALYLDELHVLQGHRRQGVASALLREATGIAREIRAWRVRLLVSDQNEGARVLYRSRGFIESEKVILCEMNTQDFWNQGFSTE